ncbi:MAG TPA: hypothetical protein VGS27_19135 [Candidatus Sulfotelmatobacter sp.]|nr:hypothetical protein [Candidatus Sulfotelmatobacter sp.]
MRKYRTSSLLLAIVFVLALLTVSCGSTSSGGRQLQSISISQVAVGTHIQFVATGTFSASPMTVSPLPADWMLGIPAPPPKQWTYTLTDQPYVYDCGNVAPSQPGQVTAIAPKDPNAPSSGTTAKAITATLEFKCQ